MRTLARLTLLAAVLSACSSELPHDAPFDPETPLAKQARARLTGKASLQGETDFSQVTVHVANASFTYEAATLKDGTFALTGIVPGTYRITYDTRYFESASAEIELEAGESLDLVPVTLALRKASLAGKALVKRLDGESEITEGGVTVVAELIGSIRSAAQAPAFRFAAATTTSVPVTSTTVSAADGGYSLELPAGRYRLTFTREDAASEDGGEITVTGDQAVISVAPVTLRPVSGFVEIMGTANAAASNVLTATPAVTLRIIAANAATMKIGWSAGGMADDCTGYVTQPYVVQVAASLPAEGQNTVCVILVREDGAESEPALASIVYDKTPPVLPLVRINGGAGYLSTNLLTLELSAVDATAGVDRMRLTTGPLAAAPLEPYLPTKVYPLPAIGSQPVEGEYTLWAQYVDRAGNASAPVSATVRVDATPPQVALAAKDVSGNEITASNQLSFFLQLDVTDLSPVTVQYSATNSFASSPLEAYQPLRLWTVAPPALPSGETRTVYARVRDAAGNAATAGPISVLVDTIAPAAPTLSLGAAETTSPTVTVSLYAEGASKVELSRDISFLSRVQFAYGPATTSFTFSGGDGVKTLYARYLDAAGNATPILSAAITLDRTPPQLASFSIDEGALTNQSTIHLRLTAIDAAWMQIAAGACGGTWVAFAGTAQLGLSPGDGPKDVFVRFRDAAGNVTACLQQTVTLDQTKPVLGVPAMLINGGSTYAKDRNVTLTINQTGATEMRLSESAGFSGSPWLPAAGTANFTLSSGDTGKTVWAQFRDAAGNTTEATAGVILDTLGPEQPLVVVGDGSGFARTTVVTLTLSATGAPVYYRATTDGVIDNKAWLPNTTATTISLGAAADGPRTVAAQFQDAAGNTSLVASAQVVLDRAAPAATSVRADDGALYTSQPQGNVTLTLNAVDAGSGLATVRIAGSAAALATAPTLPFEPTKLFTLAQPGSDGLKQVWVAFGDKAGNYAAAVSDLITLDRTPPTAVLTPANGTLVTSSIQPVHIDAPADTESMMLSNDATFSGAAWQPFQSDVVWTFPAVQGTVWVYGKFRDRAGNASPSYFAAAVTIDSVAPAVGSVAALVQSDTLVWDHFGSDVTGYSVLLYQGSTILSVTNTTEKRLAVGKVAPTFIVVAHYADGSSSLPSYPPGYYVASNVRGLLALNMTAAENNLVTQMPAVAALGAVTTETCAGQVVLQKYSDYMWPVPCGKSNAVYFNEGSSWGFSAPKFTPVPVTTTDNPFAAVPFEISGTSIAYPRHAYNRTYLKNGADLYWPMANYPAAYNGQPILVGNAFNPGTLSGENFMELSAPLAAAAVTDDASYSASGFAGGVPYLTAVSTGTFALAVSAPMAGFMAATANIYPNSPHVLGLNGLWNGEYSGYGMLFPGTVQVPYANGSEFDGANTFKYSNAQYYCTYQYVWYYPYYLYNCNTYGTYTEVDTLNGDVHFVNTSPYYYSYSYDSVAVVNADGTRSYRVPVQSNSQGTFHWSREWRQTAFDATLAKMIRRVASPVRVRGTGQAVLTSNVPQAYGMQVSSNASFTGSVWQDYQQTVTLPEGSTQVWVRYRDVAGNVTPAQQVTVVAPSTAPKLDAVQIAGPNASPGFSTSSNVTARLLGSYPAGSRARFSPTPSFSDAGWQTIVNNEVPITLPSQAGRYYYYFWVADPSNNYSLPVSGSVLFDGTPPQAEFSVKSGGSGWVALQGRYTVSVSPYQPSITDATPVAPHPNDMHQVNLGFGFPTNGATTSTVWVPYWSNCVELMSAGMQRFCAIGPRNGTEVESMKLTPSSLLYVWSARDAFGTPFTSAVELHASGLVRLIYWRTKAHVRLWGEVNSIESPYNDWFYALAQGSVEYMPNPDGVRFVLRSNHGTVIDYAPEPCLNGWCQIWKSFPVTDSGYTRWTGTAYSGGGAAGRVTVRDVYLSKDAIPGPEYAYASALSNGLYWLDYEGQAVTDQLNFMVDDRWAQGGAVVRGQANYYVNIGTPQGNTRGVLTGSPVELRRRGAIATSGAPVRADPVRPLVYAADGSIFDVSNPEHPQAIKNLGGSWPQLQGQAARFGNLLWSASGVWDVSTIDSPVLVSNLTGRSFTPYKNRMYVATGSDIRVYDAANPGGGVVATINVASTGPLFTVGTMLYAGNKDFNGNYSWYSLDLYPNPLTPSTSYITWNEGFYWEGGFGSGIDGSAVATGSYLFGALNGVLTPSLTGIQGTALPLQTYSLDSVNASVYATRSNGVDVMNVGMALPASVERTPASGSPTYYSDSRYIYECSSSYGFAWYDHDLNLVGSKAINCFGDLTIQYPWVYKQEYRWKFEGGTLVEKNLFLGDNGMFMPIWAVGGGYTDWNGNWRPLPEIDVDFEFASNAGTPSHSIMAADRDLVYVQLYRQNYGNVISATTATALQYSGIVSGLVKPPLVSLIETAGNYTGAANGFISTTSGTYFVESLASVRLVGTNPVDFIGGNLARDNMGRVWRLTPDDMRVVAQWDEAGSNFTLSPRGMAVGYDQNTLKRLSTPWGPATPELKLRIPGIDSALAVAESAGFVYLAAGAAGGLRKLPLPAAAASNASASKYVTHFGDAFTQRDSFSLPETWATAGTAATVADLCNAWKDRQLQLVCTSGSTLTADRLFQGDLGSTWLALPVEDSIAGNATSLAVDEAGLVYVGFDDGGPGHIGVFSPQNGLTEMWTIGSGWLLPVSQLAQGNGYVVAFDGGYIDAYRTDASVAAPVWWLNVPSLGKLAMKGEFLAYSDGATLNLLNPANGALVRTCPVGSAISALDLHQMRWGGRMHPVAIAASGSVLYAVSLDDCSKLGEWTQPAVIEGVRVQGDTLLLSEGNLGVRLYTLADLPKLGISTWLRSGGHVADAILMGGMVYTRSPVDRAEIWQLY